MPGLPKIALARLKVNPKSSGPPLGPEGFQGADHPDANLLAAFVEKTLTERERTQVLNHLVQCAECREVAAFSLPWETVAAEPTRVAGGRRWSPWPVLRWGAMAAVLGALTIVVVLHPGMWKGPQEISKKMPPPVPVGNITSAPQTVSPSPLAPLPPEPSRARAQLEARGSAGKLAAKNKALGQRDDLALDDHVARAQAKQQVTVMASTRPPAMVRAENVPGVEAKREEGKEGNALTAGGLPTAPPPPAPAAVPTAPSEEAAKANAESQAGPAPLRATSQSVAVKAGSAGGFGGGGISAGATPAKPASRLTSDASVRTLAKTSMGALQASRKDMGFAASPPAALWSVASDGNVQRSTDGGKTFEQIHVAHDIKFRAIAALGNDVWTGGAGGALYHSLDGGATWTRVVLNFGGNSVTETLAGIQLHDPQHLTVTTASGSQWASEDGGQNWRQKP
jgi:hypothetical protein